jgi:hypothetical protein
MSQFRERIYKVIQVFYSEYPNVVINTSDVVYTNVGDNNFYLEQKKNTTVIHILDWDLAKKAIRYGWLELLKVESDE